jgi:hypothetical protein
MPSGKTAGVRCAQLTDDNRCRLFGRAERPAVCIGFRPSPDCCGDSREQAMTILDRLEASTARSR